MTLTDFVLARIAEREAVAQHGIEELDPGQTELKVTIWDLDTHIRYRPHYELARCAVDRRIIAEHRPTATQRTSEGHECRTCLSPAYRYDWPNLWTAQPWPCTTLRLLASVDADHPDYDDAWDV